MSEVTKEKLLTFRSVFFREKYRFDQGNAFLVFVNFAMLVVTLVKQNHINENIITWYIALGLACTWALGYFLDKFVKVQDASERVAFKRSPIWKENFNHHDKMHKKVEEIDKKLDSIQKLIAELKELENK